MSSKGKKQAYSRQGDAQKRPVNLAGSSLKNPSVQLRSFYDLRPTWAFSKADHDHENWGIASNSAHIVDVLKHLGALECLGTWRNVFTATSGRKSNTRNHAIPVENLDKKARERLIAMNLDDVDELHSIALDNRLRVFGIMLEGVYHVLWIDPEHSICPSAKRYT